MILILVQFSHMYFPAMQLSSTAHACEVQCACIVAAAPLHRMFDMQLILHARGETQCAQLHPQMSAFFFLSSCTCRSFCTPASATGVLAAISHSYCSSKAADNKHSSQTAATPQQQSSPAASTMFNGELKAAANKLQREQQQRAERDRQRLAKEKALAERQRQRQAAREEEGRQRRLQAAAAAAAVSACGMMCKAVL